ALGAALIGTAAYGFLQFNSATNQAKTSLDELTTAQQTFTKAVMSGDQQLVASARQQLQILKNEADAEAERLREQIAAGSAIAGIDIREGTPVRSFTDFLGITSTNEDLTEAGFLLQRAEGRSRRLEAQLSAVVLNPDLLTDVEGLSTLFDNALQRGNELSTAYSTAFLGESPLQRLARENREYNESVDELIDNETRRISGAREQNQLDGGILTSEASLAADERRIAEADAIRNTTNDEFNEAYLRGLATRNEKELSARMALEERILAAALAGDRRREAQAEQERLDTIQATNDNISAGIGLASGDFNVDSVNTLLGNFATRLSEADGAVGMFGAELLSALPGIGQFLQIATAIPNIVGQRNFTGNEEFTANFQNGGFTDGNRTAETIYTGLIGAATRLQTGSRRGTEEIGLDSREFTGFQLGATRARVALRQYFDVVGEGTGVFDLAGESYEEVVAGIEDGLAGTVDGLSAVTREGESAASALARVANSFKDSNDALLEAGFGGLNNAILTGDAFSRVGGITNIADTLSLRTRQDRIRLAEDEYRRRLVGAAGNPFRNDQGTLIDPDGPTVDVRNNFERFNTREEFLGLIDTLTDAVRAAEQEIAPGVQTIREQFNRVRFDPTSFADATTQEQIDNRIEAFENRRDSQILALTSEALDPAILRLQSALEAQDEFELLFGSGRTALNLGSSGFATEADQRLAQAIRSDADPNQSVIDTIQKLIDANNGNFAGLTTAFEDGTSAAEFLNSQA
nr:hypothetical protein [Gammaproteobacteria bacterium]